jgi:hypothetical protein
MQTETQHCKEMSLITAKTNRRTSYEIENSPFKIVDGLSLWEESQISTDMTYLA